jgi:hypothetical protein
VQGSSAAEGGGVEDDAEATAAAAAGVAKGRAGRAANQVQFVMRTLLTALPNDPIPVLEVHVAVLKAAHRHRALLADYLQNAQARLRFLQQRGWAGGPGRGNGNTGGGEGGGGGAAAERRELVAGDEAAARVTAEAEAEATALVATYAERGEVPADTAALARTWKKAWWDGQLVPALLYPTQVPADAAVRERLLEELASRHLVRAAAVGEFRRRCALLAAQGRRPPAPPVAAADAATALRRFADTCASPSSAAPTCQDPH